MKKMKKILAMLLALTMVLGMSLTSMAATPAVGDTAEATVSNVKVGATVTAYQIIKGDYGTNGFLGYEEVVPEVGVIELISGTYLTESEKPTAEEVTALAAAINAEELVLKSENIVSLQAAQVAEGSETTNYVAELTAGYWIVLVEGTVDVYNPMLIGVYYTDANNDETLEGGSVALPSNWKLIADDAYAKSSSPEIHKNSNKTTYAEGETITYTVSTVVPDYSNAYENADIVFNIVDAVDDTELVLDPSTIHIDIKNNKTEAVYELKNATAAGYTVEFDSAWIADNANAEIIITYNATMTNGIYADMAENNSYDNTVTLTYTNAPDDTEEATATESVFTFRVSNVITKIGEGDDADKLPGAVFGIYKDEECNEAYTGAGDTPITVTSDNDGYVNIDGLDLGTYYIKETDAPDGYSLNNEVFEIVISADCEKVEDDADTVKNISVTIDGEETATILNTSLIFLPSTGGIGTTIFTVAGCGIMVAAAYLFFASRKKES